MLASNVTFERGDNTTVVHIAINAICKTDGEGLWGSAAKNVFVTHATIVVADDEDDGDGDLGVFYDERTWDNSVDGLIYTDALFVAQLRALLISAGFSNEAANNVDYSEEGMQDDGRVSFDAYLLADAVRCLNATV